MLTIFLSTLILIATEKSYAQLVAKDSKIEFKIRNVSVVVEAGNLLTSSGEAVAFAGSGSFHGAELVVGRSLRNAGAEKGFQELDKMFEAQGASGGFGPGSAQIVESGGGNYTYIINLATQDYARTGSGLDIQLGEQRLIADAISNLLNACVNARSMMSPYPSLEQAVIMVCTPPFR